MKAYIQNYLGYTTYNPATQPALLYYMSGSVPQTAADVKAIVDLSDMSDLHSKCVGCSLVSGTVAADTTGIGSFNTTYTLYGAAYSWLKSGSMSTQSGTQYYVLPPSRVYYTNGRKSTLWAMPPSLFAMPVNCISNTNTVPTANSVKFTDVAASYTYKQVGSEIFYTLEYDQSTTVSALRVSSGYECTTNAYVYSANVDYWNGSAWVNAVTGANGSISDGGVYTITFTAVTATKFRITLYPYLTANTSYTMSLGGGIALMHTSVPASTVSIADITWGVLVPMPALTSVLYTSVYLNDTVGGNTYCISPSFNTAAYDPTNNPLIGRSAPFYGLATTNIPAIIDSCGQDSTANKMAISKSTLLISSDRPTLASYKYYSGDLL
jgi:hypothetical protein